MRMRLAALVLALALLLSGCARSGPDAGGEPDIDYGLDAGFRPDVGWGPGSMGGSSQEEGTDPAGEGAALPESFALAWHRGHSLDPVTCGEGVQQELGRLLYEPLFRLDGSFSPVPVLCERLEWDGDGLACTVFLREGAAFSDGSGLTARDVAETLNRARESERYAYRLRYVRSVEANRQGEVRITLSAPNRGLSALLDIPIVKWGTEGRTVPVGTGPYVLTEEGGEAYLLAREDWWQGKRPSLARISLIDAKDRAAALNCFSTRKAALITVDPLNDGDSVLGETVSTARATASMQYIGFNTAEGRVFADSSARAAFSLGIERDKLASDILSGRARAAQFPISPLSELYPEDLEGSYDREDTLRRLKSAGQDTGEKKELIFLVNADDLFQVRSARFIASSLSLLDWSVTVRALPWREYGEALRAGEYDLYYAETRLTPDWDLRELVGSGGSLNYGGYSNATVDQLLERFAGEEDRRANVRALCSALASEAPIAPVCFLDYAVLTRPGVVEGLSPTPGNPFAGIENWTVHLSPAPEEAGS